MLVAHLRTGINHKIGSLLDYTTYNYTCYTYKLNNNIEVCAPILPNSIYSCAVTIFKLLNVQILKFMYRLIFVTECTAIKKKEKNLIDKSVPYLNSLFLPLPFYSHHDIRINILNKRSLYCGNFYLVSTRIKKSIGLQFGSFDDQVPIPT